MLCKACGEPLDASIGLHRCDLAMVTAALHRDRARRIVEDEGAAYGLLWSVEGAKITPTEHYATPGRAAYLRTLRGDDKNFGTESYGIELAKNESAVGRVWASGHDETVDKPANDKQFARQQLAEDFNITKICLEHFAGGVLEFGFAATGRSVQAVQQSERPRSAPQAAPARASPIKMVPCEDCDVLIDPSTRFGMHKCEPSDIRAALLRDKVRADQERTQRAKAKKKRLRTGIAMAADAHAKRLAENRAESVKPVAEHLAARSATLKSLVCEHRDEHFHTQNKLFKHVRLAHNCEDWDGFGKHPAGHVRLTSKMHRGLRNDATTLEDQTYNCFHTLTVGRVDLAVILTSKPCAMAEAIQAEGGTVCVFHVHKGFDLSMHAGYNRLLMELRRCRQRWLWVGLPKDAWSERSRLEEGASHASLQHWRAKQSKGRRLHRHGRMLLEDPDHPATTTPSWPLVKDNPKIQITGEVSTTAQTDRRSLFYDFDAHNLPSLKLHKAKHFWHCRFSECEFGACDEDGRLTASERRLVTTSVDVHNACGDRRCSREGGHPGKAIPAGKTLRLATGLRVRLPQIILLSPLSAHEKRCVAICPSHFVLRSLDA